MEALHKFRDILMKILGYLITLLFVFMTLIGTYQIVTRYFLNKPSTVSEELLTYTFTWMALLSSAYVFGKRDHMRMGFMADKIRGIPRKALEIAIDLLTFLFAAVVMVYGGIAITKLTMIQITASLQVPMGYIYLIIPISGILIMIFSIVNAFDMLHTDFDEKEEIV
jgi:TRAP-type C4-dicarboxylate transport system permease small subunit